MPTCGSGTPQPELSDAFVISCELSHRMAVCILCGTTFMRNKKSERARPTFACRNAQGGRTKAQLFPKSTRRPRGSGTRHRGPAKRPPDSMAEEGDGTSSSKKRRIESLEKRIKGGGGFMGLGALSARTTKKQQPKHQPRRRPDKGEGGGAGPGGAGFGSNGGRGFGSGGGGGAKRANGPADAKPRAPERSDPSRLRSGADASTSRGSDGGPDAAWYAPVGSRTRAGVMSSAHARAFPRNLLPSEPRGDDDETSRGFYDDETSRGDAAADASNAGTRRAWIRQHLRDLVATNPKAGADAEAVITSKTKDKALLLDSANGAFSVDEVRAARARRLARAGRDARLVGAAAAAPPSSRSTRRGGRRSFPCTSCGARTSRVFWRGARGEPRGARERRSVGSGRRSWSARR